MSNKNLASKHRVLIEKIVKKLSIDDFVAVKDNIGTTNEKDKEILNLVLISGNRISYAQAEAAKNALGYEIAKSYTEFFFSREGLSMEHYLTGINAIVSGEVSVEEILNTDYYDAVQDCIRKYNIDPNQREIVLVKKHKKLLKKFKNRDLYYRRDVEDSSHYDEHNVTRNLDLDTT